MPLKLHHDIEVTVTDGRRLKLHRDIIAERAPRRGDMLYIDLFSDDPAHSRRVRIGDVIWSLDCSEAVVARVLSSSCRPSRSTDSFSRAG